MTDKPGYPKAVLLWGGGVPAEGRVRGVTWSIASGFSDTSKMTAVAPRCTARLAWQKETAGWHSGPLTFPLCGHRGHATHLENKMR